MSLAPDASVDAFLQTAEGICAITHEPLKTDEIIKTVGDNGAGAIAIFIGTTRDSFKGAYVVCLWYDLHILIDKHQGKLSPNSNTRHTPS
jgi:molybdopterin synthase catalytic subunit